MFLNDHSPNKLHLFFTSNPSRYGHTISHLNWFIWPQSSICFFTHRIPSSCCSFLNASISTLLSMTKPTIFFFSLEAYWLSSNNASVSAERIEEVIYVAWMEAHIPSSSESISSSNPELNHSCSESIRTRILAYWTWTNSYFFDFHSALISSRMNEWIIFRGTST